MKIYPVPEHEPSLPAREEGDGVLSLSHWIVSGVVT